MRLFSWKPEDSVGNEKIDRQHREFFDVTQRLYDALTRGDGTGIAEEVINYLIGHSAEHFHTEERLMEEHGYPQLKSHKASHREFTNTVLSFKRDLDAGKESVAALMLPWLQSWIKNHTQGADRRFAEFLKSTAKVKAEAAGS